MSVLLLSEEIFPVAQVKVPCQRTEKGFLPIPSTSVFAVFLSFEEGFFCKYSGGVEHLSKYHVS